MRSVWSFIKQKPKKVLTWAFIVLAIVGLVVYYQRTGFSLEEFITALWEEHVETWGYVILFCWGILEGELGLIFAGLAVHDGKMQLLASIFVAGLGGFVGDQIYFYIGRFNRKGIQESFKSQRRKFALANLLLQKYGWPIIFVQRYMYGMRTIIPMSIGTTRYDGTKFAIIHRGRVRIRYGRTLPHLVLVLSRIGPEIALSKVSAKVQITLAVLRVAASAPIIVL